MITFSQVSTDAEKLLQYEELFKTCFSAAEKFSPEALHWLYALNPDGPVLGFDATDGDVLAAHYVCIPTMLRVEGVAVKGLLSLNTATHPRYQGKGLFTKLAEMTYSAAAEMGFQSVYGIANANSTPGFVRKLGFQLVAPLEAKLGIGRLNVDFECARSNTQFERIWTSDSIRWRISNPVNQIKSIYSNQRLCFYAKAFGHLLPAYAELYAGLQLPPAASRRVATPFGLYIGLLPKNSCDFSTFIDIPNKLKPSPLNLIYRPLGSSGLKLDPDRVFISFLDFDAY